MTGNVIIDHLILGFWVSFLFSLPPGMISLNVLQATIYRGLKSAAYLALAAVLVESVQAFIGVKFAELINSSPGLKLGIEIFVIPVFFVMGAINIYHGVKDLKKKGGPEETKPKRTISSFGKGLLVSALNPVAIPFWVFYSAFLQKKGWLDVSKTAYIVVFTIGTTLGTYACLLMYGVLSSFIARKIHSIKVWISFVIGALFVGLGIYQIIVLI
jgi:threonine/homoserine/homoserine lactone efflux protein